jgi:hypothetical protein
MHNSDSILLESLYEEIISENMSDLKNVTVKSDAQKKLAQVEEDDLKIIGDAIGKPTMKESFAKYFVNKL